MEIYGKANSAGNIACVTAGVRRLHTSFALVAALMLATLLFAGVQAPMPAHAATAQDTAASTSTDTAAKKGWVTTASGAKKYYVKGVAVTGARKIGGTWRAFSASGKLMYKAFKLSGVTYFSNEKGVLEARKAKGSYYYANGKKMSRTDAYEYKTIVKARAIATKITKPSQTKAQKLRTCFNWVRAKYYAIHRAWSGSSTWPAVYAMDHFNNKNGDCHSDAAAFAYLAYAIGYTKVYCCTDSGKTAEDNHGWAEVNGRVYDPLFDQSKSGSYFARSYSSYMTSAPSTKVKIPLYSSKNASKTATSLSSKNGLVKSGSAYYYYINGKKLQNAWKTVGGKRYYFTKSGKAATYAYKVKGSYYVFSKKGVLQKGSATRLVTVGSRVYRVAKSGKAVKGWNSAKTQYCDKTGRLLCGVWLVGSKLYAAGSDGVYDAERTAALRAATVVNGDAATLLQLLGTPKKSTYMASCNTVNGLGGKDGILEYAHVKITTFLDTAGNEWLMGIEAA